MATPPRSSHQQPAVLSPTAHTNSPSSAASPSRSAAVVTTNAVAGSHHHSRLPIPERLDRLDAVLSRKGYLADRNVLLAALREDMKDDAAIRTGAGASSSVTSPSSTTTGGPHAVNSSPSSSSPATGTQPPASLSMLSPLKAFESGWSRHAAALAVADAKHTSTIPDSVVAELLQSVGATMSSAQDEGTWRSVAEKLNADVKSLTDRNLELSRKVAHSERRQAELESSNRTLRAANEELSTQVDVLQALWRQVAPWIDLSGLQATASDATTSVVGDLPMSAYVDALRDAPTATVGSADAAANAAAAASSSKQILQLQAELTRYRLGASWGLVPGATTAPPVADGSNPLSA